MAKPKVERLSDRLAAGVMIEEGANYLTRRVGGYEPVELLRALDLARVWVAAQIALNAAKSKEKQK